MGSSNVAWYSFGFNIVDKQGYFYYGLEGDSSAQQIDVTAPELTALAEMLRDGGQVVFNEINDLYYLVTERHDVVPRPPIERGAPPTHPHPGKGRNEASPGQSRVQGRTPGAESGGVPPRTGEGT
ncbi:MAG: hypothetical protein ACKOVB_04825 [Terrabacter sp.]